MSTDHPVACVPGSAREGRWCVYILRCADGSLYTGCTNRLRVRVELHDQGRGAKYTRSRRPVRLVWVQEQPDRGSALRLEARVKRLRRPGKLSLIREGRAIEMG